MTAAWKPGFITAKCPECGLENKVILNYSINEYDPQIVTCDSDNGGCENYFAVRVKLLPEVTVFRVIDVDEEKLKAMGLA